MSAKKPKLYMAEKIYKTRNKLSLQIIVLFFIILFIQIVNGFYAIYDLSPPRIFSVLGYLGIFWIIGDWFIKDSKKRGIEWAFDMGFFIYLSWPVFLPFYLFKTRGFKNAVIICLSFIALYFGVYFLSYYIFYNINL